MVIVHHITQEMDVGGDLAVTKTKLYNFFLRENIFILERSQKTKTRLVLDSV